MDRHNPVDIVTDILRQERQAEIHSDTEKQESPQSARARLEQRYGQVWSPSELARDFEVVGFMAPFVVALRKEDGVTGSLEFQHHPRFYFNWAEDK